MDQQVHSLIAKAEKAQSADDALKFSQAACNAANAMRALNDVTVSWPQAKRDAWKKLNDDCAS